MWPWPSSAVLKDCVWTDPDHCDHVCHPPPTSGLTLTLRNHTCDGRWGQPAYLHWGCYPGVDSGTCSFHVIPLFPRRYVLTSKGTVSCHSQLAGQAASSRISRVRMAEVSPGPFCTVVSVWCHLSWYPQLPWFPLVFSLSPWSSPLTFLPLKCWLPVDIHFHLAIFLTDFPPIPPHKEEVFVSPPSFSKTLSPHCCWGMSGSCLLLNWAPDWPTWSLPPDNSEGPPSSCSQHVTSNKTRKLTLIHYCCLIPISHRSSNNCPIAEEGDFCLGFWSRGPARGTASLSLHVSLIFEARFSVASLTFGEEWCL